ncbi:Cna B-type domain-containing protein, partial [Eggerthia catenaformis]|uniref:Cna B-type domain-containing protein n=1 Tax=Eggerthia catenaformis TaxID=31973 RepID=UPI0028E53E86
MKKRLKNVILLMALVFSALSFPVMAKEHSIDITRSTGNGIFGCSLKVKTMEQLKKIRGIKVNGETFTKVSNKSDLNSGKKYILSETDPDIFLSAVKDRDKIEITTDTEKVTVTVKNANAFGNMHDPASITYSKIEDTGEDINTPDLEIESSEVNFAYNQLRLKFKKANMAEKIKEVKVNGRSYIKKDSKLTPGDGFGHYFYIDPVDNKIYLTDINNGDKVELITDKGITSFTAQKMGLLGTSGNNYKDIKFKPKSSGNDFSIKVFKKNENGQGLAGAKFEVVKAVTGNVVGNITTDVNGNGRIDNLSKENYIIRETKAPLGYIKSKQEIEVKANDFNSGTKEAFKEIVNKKEKTSVSGKKIWKDEDNRDGIRPKEIEIVLYANGYAIQNKTVEADVDGNWNYKFDDLDKYDDDGNLIDYMVKEEAVAGYKATYNGFTITNEHKPETITIRGSKKWIDDNDKEKKRPDEIKIGLYKGNKKIRETKATKTNNWEFKFENLPKNEKGKEIEYTIKEEPVAGYTSSIKKVSKNVYEIVNTITGKVSIPVTKTWVGPKGTKAVVKLFANGTEKQKVELNQGNNWSYIFENLDKYDGQGKKIVYTLKEESIQNYDSQITGDAETGFKVKNINTEKISIPVVKKWVGKPADSVTIKLLADGKEKIRAVLTKDSSWKDKFSNLPKYDDKDGHEIIYSISEVKVNGYNTGITGTARDGFTITNTITGKVSIPVTKLWAGKEGISATVRLYANNKEIKSTVLNKGNGWQYTFTNLKKYKNGHEIKYTIKEDPIENYKSEITGNEIKGFIVKNTNTEKVSVKGTKTWDDANNQDGKRPTQITVNLLKNGTKFKSVTVKADADGNWKYEFTNLDKYENKKEIKYTVEEEKVEGYETKVEGYNIKNTHTPEKTELK